MLSTGAVSRAMRMVLRPPHLFWLRIANRWLGYRRLRAKVPPVPTTFTQKLHHRMAYDRRPLLRIFADKIAVRGYVSQRLGDEYLSQLHGVYDRGRDIRWGDIPRDFVLKPSHGADSLVIVWEGNSRGEIVVGKARWGYKLLAHPDDLDREAVERLAQGWLRLDYQYRHLRAWPEWCYSGIPHRIVIEELLLNAQGGLPADYKFFMFDGACAAVEVDFSRFAEHRQYFFTPQWEPLAVQKTYPHGEIEPPRPPNLEEMLTAAETLSQGIDFVRVDLYDLGARVVFGELTNYPAAGLSGFEPPEFDEFLGSLWTLPSRYERR